MAWVLLIALELFWRCGQTKIIPFAFAVAISAALSNSRAWHSFSNFAVKPTYHVSLLLPILCSNLAWSKLIQLVIVISINFWLYWFLWLLMLGARQCNTRCRRTGYDVIRVTPNYWQKSADRCVHVYAENVLSDVFLQRSHWILSWTLQVKIAIWLHHE